MFETRELPAWNRRVAALLGELAVRAPAQGFQAALRHRACGTLAVSAFDSSPACVNGAASGSGCFVLLNRSGASRVSQHGREAELGPGDAALLRRDRAYRVAFAQSNRMLVLALPTDPRCDLGACAAQRQGGSAAALLGTFMTYLLDAAAVPRPDIARRMAQDLMVMLWPGGPGDEAPGSWESRLLALVEQQLQDPDLDARALGRTLGISARYVQMLFARRGTTLSAHLLERRLQWVAVRLQSEPRATTIGTLAFDAGFGDLSHFCRSFQRRFGCSASQWRHRH